MIDARHHLKRGLFWIGSANLLNQLIDLVSIIIILAFLSKEEMGIATLAWTVAVIMEAFNGLGMSTALVQAKTLSRNQQDSSWWYIMVLAAALFGGMALGSPLIAGYYESPQLQPMIVLAASKLFFVGAAIMPLQLMNRDLRFKEIGTSQTLATLLASILKITLVISGLGAWALVIAYTARGAFLAIIVYAFRPFRPRLHFAFDEIRKLSLFGVKVTMSSTVYHFYRNADYLIVGKFLGTEALGVYRVAFEVAMTPALAILNVVNRAALPVFSALSEQREKLADTFIWMQKNLGLLVTPVAIFMTFAAGDLMQLVGDNQWIDAAPAIRILAWAALLRSLDQTFPQLFHAAGRPGLAVYDSLISVGVLVGSFSTALYFFGDSHGILAVCWAWLLSYPLLITILFLFARRVVPLRPGAWFAAFKHVVLMSALVVGVSVALTLARRLVEIHPLVFSIALGGASLGLMALYLRYVLRLRFRDIVRASAKPREEDGARKDETS